ncbi:hypothetical protein XHV734_3536 [Xanthomonas hortorum pv. vitians]|nr:hypothetical protein XHV734_3536 [Xanthomonas hortorum pv. vitians]
MVWMPADPGDFLALLQRRRRSNVVILLFPAHPCLNVRAPLRLSERTLKPTHAKPKKSTQQ